MGNSWGICAVLQCQLRWFALITYHKDQFHDIFIKCFLLFVMSYMTLTLRKENT